MKIIINKDKGFFYKGIVKVQAYKVEKIIKTINIECDVEPYKYELYSSDEDWLWDTFDFEDGIINETKDLEVNGELEVNITGRRKKVVPKFNCSKSVDLIFNETTYTLPEGTSYCTDIEIEEGNNTLKFIGNSTITIEYRGGSL